jgi:hypothetical protein
MTWTVIWKPAAERQLAKLWIIKPDRKAVSGAANRIDFLLKHFPEAVGESRDQGRRILIEPPLAVIYRVDPLDRKVIVSAVWYI